MDDRSFGIIPIRRNNGSYEFLLIQHHAGHWSFPKGHKDEGESDIETAKREFTEETGLELERVLEKESYDEEFIFRRAGRLIRKKVTYFIGLVKPGEYRLQSAEIKEAAWLPFDEALAKLSFKETKEILMKIVGEKPAV